MIASSSHKCANFHYTKISAYLLLNSCCTIVATVILYVVFWLNKWKFFVKKLTV